MSRFESNACREFNRASFIREAAAAAGRGLPVQEPGAPLPAGTGLSRRSFVLRSAGIALTLFGGKALSPHAYEYGVAEASAASPNAPVLVSIVFEGGLDGM